MFYDIRAYSFRPPHRTKRVCPLACNLALWSVLPLYKNREKIIVERFGYYFKRELHYDFAPYSAESREHTNQAYLLAEHRGIHCIDPRANIHHAVGAIGFTTSDDKPHVLQWAWVHPYLRRRGILRSAWAALEERHSEFSVRAPLSVPMEQFLNRIDPDGIHSPV